MDPIDPKTNNTTQNGAVETDEVIALKSDLTTGFTQVNDKKNVMIFIANHPLTRPEVELVGDVWWALRVRMGLEARQEAIRQADAAGAHQAAAVLQEAMFLWIISLKVGG